MNDFWNYVRKIHETYSDEMFDDLIDNTFGTGRSMNLPAPTLHPDPSRVRSKVVQIRYNETPIKVRLENGIVWTLTMKQWEILRAKGQNPTEGSVVEAEMLPDGTVKSIRVDRSVASPQRMTQPKRTGSSPRTPKPNGSVRQLPV